VRKELSMSTQNDALRRPSPLAATAATILGNWAASVSGPNPPA
jgi:hypothetical protein